MCLGAVGSQTAGSIIRPAAFCGVSGLKPTFGRVDRSGVLVSCPSLDHVGALAGSAADLKLLWQVLADPRPAHAQPATAGQEKSSSRASSSLASARPSPGRSGLSDAAAAGGDRADGMLAEASPEVLLVLEATLGWLESHGGRAGRGQSAGRAGRNPGHASGAHDGRDGPVSPPGFCQRRGRFGPQVAKLIEEGLATDTARYDAARRHQTEFRMQLAGAMAGVDAWILPATNHHRRPLEHDRRSASGDPLELRRLAGHHPSRPAWPKTRCRSGCNWSGRPEPTSDCSRPAVWCEERLGFGEAFLPQLLAELG